MMKMWRVLLVVAMVFGASRAYAAGDIYIPATAFEYASTNACTSLVHSGTNFPFTAASCTGGQSFFFHVAIPADANAQPGITPEIQWEAQTTTNGTVCWNASFLAGAQSTGLSYNGLGFAPLATPQVGQNSGIISGALHWTGNGVADLTALNQAGVLRTPGNACLGNCTNAILVGKITRNALCDAVPLPTGTPAEVVQVHLLYS